MNNPLTRTSAAIYRMLKSTPGVVTDKAFHHVIWNGRKPPKELREHVLAIKHATGELIIRHPRFGYELVR